MVMPVMPAAPPPAPLPAPAEDAAAAHEGTMVMPVMPAAPPPAPAPAPAEDAAAHEGTMLMPAMAAAPTPVTPAPAEETHPDLVPPATPEAAREATGAPAPMPAPEAPVPTAADIIRQTFADAPNAEARTIKVTQGSLPELRMPEIPELAAVASPAAPAPVPEPVAPEPDPELPRSTLHMPLRDMPEARHALEASRTAPAAWAPPGPLLPPPAPSPAEPWSDAPTAAVPAGAGAPASGPAHPKAAPGPARPASEEPKGASGLLWAGVIVGIALLGGGLWAWNLGWFGLNARPVPRPSGEPGATPAPAPKPEADEAANVPEQMRPAYEKALAGDPNAMRFLGVCYVNGLGVPANLAEGLKWYRRAAAAGSAAAQRDLQALEAQGIR
jgi:Meckel syndrome type 1 protein